MLVSLFGWVNPFASFKSYRRALCEFYGLYFSQEMKVKLTRWMTESLFTPIKFSMDLIECIMNMSSKAFCVPGAGIGVYLQTTPTSSE